MSWKKYGIDKEIFYNNADIFIFPTFYLNECFPLVLLEAMQHGLPCISTREGGIPSIIEDGKTGLLVERQNANDLADKIGWMIENPNKRRLMGCSGKVEYNEKYALKSFEYGIKDFFKTLLKNQKYGNN